MMGIVVPETCWAYKKYNKIASDIYLLFYSSVIWINVGSSHTNLLIALRYVVTV